MLYAVMSDIHANPWALEKALADARAQGAEKFVCLGDVVGYGPDAVGAARLAKSAFDVVLMGNHDAATVGLISSWNFRPEAKAGVFRHGLELGAEELGWLKGLPHVHRGGTFLAVHGSLSRPEAFEYIMTEEAALEAFRLMVDRSLLFVGHTHASLAVEQTGPGTVLVHPATELALRAGHRHIVNVGSVGYPRTEPESVYALYDSRTHRIVWRRLPFDYAGYVARMEEKSIGLPKWLAEDAAAAGKGR